MRSMLLQTAIVLPRLSFAGCTYTGSGTYTRREGNVLRLAAARQTGGNG